MYYRDLINFKNQGDPAVMLRCVNPKEAALLDAASGTHVKFRLAGVSIRYGSIHSVCFEVADNPALWQRESQLLHECKI